MPVQSNVPTIPDVIPGNWDSVMRFSRDVRKYLNSLAKSDQTGSYTTVTLSGLTPSRLVSTDSGSTLESTDLAAWLNGTVNEITATDNGDGTITLSFPSDIIVDASAGKVQVTDNATSKPSSESDGYVGVAEISSDGRLYFFVEGTRYYVSGTADSDIETGNPIGLLLSLTYNIP